ncbi:hypothetical protein GCM10011506_28320 [Marivirga lumbricoides]|uniref:DUF4870 domain-containing protein n=1 Tax=Marivirga lumbricoides TaxID=1046115 RepID=A0A2T4DVD5_9BACT|nr:hypothetical protein C9994_01620 [Marivirga lumbricoides]GGC41073.1 hypothetical protein GCM10011506_28320 [Marivirga lumbricoides]
MITTGKFFYKVDESEGERASNSYLMSLVAIVAGLPLPIINLLATFIFYLGNRKSTPFVRWHCTQALFSQLSLVIINSIGFWWTMSMIVGANSLSNDYIGYMIVLLSFNLGEFIATIYTAIQTRKGIHVKWWFYGDFSDAMIKD